MHPTNRPRFASLLPVVSLVLLSFACSDPNDPVGVPPAPTLAPTTQWAGGIVRLTLESIDASDPAPSLLLDGADALPVVQVGDVETNEGCRPVERFGHARNLP